MIPGGTRICKVCGKEYEYCKTKARGAFQWQDVACCVEHANQYFEEVAIARGEKKAPTADPIKKQNKEPFIKKKSDEKKDEEK